MKKAEERREPISASGECEDDGLTLAYCSKQLPVMSPVNVSNDCGCTSPCCSIERKREAYQPKERAILSSFVKNGRKFLPWYETYAWITHCTTRKKVFGCIWVALCIGIQLVCGSIGASSIAYDIDCMTPVYAYAGCICIRSLYMHT